MRRQLNPLALVMELHCLSPEVVEARVLPDEHNGHAGWAAEVQVERT